MNQELILPKRLLMGPGPSDVHPHVLKAMATPLLGHLDPTFLNIMNETMELIRYVYETKNQVTIAMSGTGSAGMETVFVNLIEPGDKVIIGVNGLFGQRMVDVAKRAGAEVIQVHAEWGRIINPDDIEKALKNYSPVKAVAVVHAETSTGANQPLEEIAKLAKEYDALMIVDAVTSLGGTKVGVDKIGIDAVYSGTQKCLSAPPGLSPVSLSDKAVEVLKSRKTKVQSWYLDLSMIQAYWGQERFYHHTAPISMIYALHEALRLIKEEGLEATFKRHEQNGRALQAGIEAMGLELFAQEGHRLPMLTSVNIPDSADDVKVRHLLLERYGLEIGGGLGPTKNKIWRVGLMGYSSQRSNVIQFLTALESILSELKIKINEGEAVKAAENYLNNHE
ncbi:pyridoxal-phosphate-dependent aminotransferase family protein [Tepidibacillus decaturensis]|uniref:Alanine--glyoxylate aminotransferase n=1 Tax=Tepidibacillus decaturensis TaxID=1413211 RepID=A0A135L6U5_9BACI|nr:alanine--glyoxylate aminotransferase family protein [Tepidibacillus decaturensis]KXG44708.1 alanine--glyoxylate aminotransferase [Tepidibacillus decaturensis]